MAKNNCPICNGNKVADFVTLSNVTLVQHLLYATQEEAQDAAVTNVSIQYCLECALLFNSEFVSPEVNYDSNYKLNIQDSNRYSDYMDATISKIMSVCNLEHDCSLLEIGCGNGEFLQRLIERTNPQEYIGFEPNHSEEEHEYIIKSLFSLDKVAEKKFDLIILRFTLEQVLEPEKMLQELKSILNPDGSIMLETIFVDKILATLDIAKTGYESHQYYSVRAISILARKVGLRVMHAETAMDEDNLVILLQHENRAPEDFHPYHELRSKINRNHKNVIWGTTGRAVTLLNILNWDIEVIKYAVDVNPEIQGQFLPVTGQQIISPQQMNEYVPDIVIVANSYHLDEIKQEVDCDCRFINTLGEFI